MPSPAPHTPIDTAPLLRVVEMFVLMSAAVIDGALTGAGVARLKKYAAEIGRATRELRRVSLFNRRGAGRARLRSDRNYLAQIRRELGGAAVIERWRQKLRLSEFPAQVELRRKRAQYLLWLKTDPDAGFAPAVPFERSAPPRQIDPAKTRRPIRTRRPVRTDASGLFRLAPVPTYLETHIYILRPNAPRLARRKPPAPRRAFAPIPLMPDELALPPIPKQESKPVQTAKPENPFSNFRHVTPEEVKDWIWNEAGQDFFPPPTRDPPPRIRRL